MFSNLSPRCLPGLLLCGVLLAGCGGGAEYEACVTRPPQFHGGGPGYELIDVTGGGVWATRQWTPDDYDEFSLPLSWSLWRKNDARVAVANRGWFLRSPGCSDGEFSYMTAFDRDFVQVVDIRKMRGHADSEKLIRRVELEKYHVLYYEAGRRILILRSPSGERFIAVSRSLNREYDKPTLPEGWMLTERLLGEDLVVELVNQVSVLRMDNQDSFQGPLPKDLL